jgi:hypothetical protein
MKTCICFCNGVHALHSCEVYSYNLRRLESNRSPFYSYAIFSNLLDASLDVNTEKTKYMLLSHHQNAGQNHDINIVNRSFEKVAQFKYLETTVKVRLS